MDSYKRKPGTKTPAPNALLIDSDINDFKEKLKVLKEYDFPIQNEFDKVSKLLMSKEELESLEIVKLLYCLGYTRQLFLFLGIILESKLNDIANTYVSKGWIAKNKAKSNVTMDMSAFIKEALFCKATKVEEGDFFNDLAASQIISNKVKALRVLRNYGGHDNNSEFIKAITIDKDAVDSEIIECFNLINRIDKAKNELIKNPPK